MVDAFASGVVPETDFIARLPVIHGLSERVIVYLSDDDSTLKWSARLMGGGRRLGLEPGKLDPHEALALRSGATPRQRGLSQSPALQVFYFAPDYAERIGRIARELPD